ncbi:hypothetical protein ABN034_14750 [Actinopolymorpha sp. B11F2]|uniref:hypothetical protein n=1 Tax=Actinopolymorpha sp. B11F2 TaxID=3160862 RepID=UPI0032E4824C
MLAESRKTVAHHGVPASTLTDNSMVYTTRLSGGKRGTAARNGFEIELRRLDVTQINSTPTHPTTCASRRRRPSPTARRVKVRSARQQTAAGQNALAA